MDFVVGGVTSLQRDRRQTTGSVDGDIFAVARCRVACLKTEGNNETYTSLASMMESEDPTASMVSQSFISSYNSFIRIISSAGKLANFSLKTGGLGTTCVTSIVFALVYFFTEFIVY